MDTVIFYEDCTKKSYEFPLLDLDEEREYNEETRKFVDIVLWRTVATKFPLYVVISIRTNGDIVLIRSRFENYVHNPYWMFKDDLESLVTPTQKQMETLEKMLLKMVEMPGGLGSWPRQPVVSWILKGRTLDEIAKKYDQPKPDLA